MEKFSFTVEAGFHKRRLDHVLCEIDATVSRSEIQRAIRSDGVSIDGRTVRQPSYRVKEGETIVWSVSSKPPLTPRELPLRVLYEDRQIVVVDKPNGLVVHPGAGTVDTTLVEALLVDRELPPSDDPTRPGVVHRLDKDTSGVIVIAKTAAALAALQRQFAARTVRKAYLAVVDGTIPEEEGWIDAPIGRDPRVPSRMAVHSKGRVAQTGFEVLRRLDGQTLVLARPRTGRTHQIRVHMRYIGHAVIGDAVYGSASSRGARMAPGGATEGTQVTDLRCANAESKCPAESRSVGNTPKGTGEASCVTGRRSANAERRSRMMLHAWRLTIVHPESGEEMRFEAPIPGEFPPFDYDDVPDVARAERA